MLHLGEVEEGPEAGALGGAEPGVVVEEVEAEVEEAGDGGLAVDEDVGLREVPSARSHEELRRLLLQLVHPLSSFVSEAYGPIHGVA